MPRLITVPICDEDPSKDETLSSNIPENHSSDSSTNKHEIGLFPRENDVICGRGKHVFNHPGNIHFMILIKDYQNHYGDCPKSLKSAFANSIYARIRELNPPGRFLKLSSRNKEENEWEEMDEKAAIMKIRQAMRDHNLRVARKHQSYEEYIESKCTDTPPGYSNQNFIDL